MGLFRQPSENTNFAKFSFTMLCYREATSLTFPFLPQSSQEPQRLPAVPFASHWQPQKVLVMLWQSYGMTLKCVAYVPIDTHRRGNSLGHSLC